MRHNSSTAPNDVDCSGWALELSNTRGYDAAFPRLNRVHMVEDCSLRPFDKYKVPDLVRDAFADAGVELIVTFKVIESVDDWISPVLR